MTRLFGVLLIGACLLRGDLAAVKAERDAEKRSELALEHAEEELAAAKKAYQANDFEGFRKSVEEVAQLVDLSQDSLDSTGKRARRKPKYFKRAEQKLLLLLRRIDSLEKDVALQDRDLVSSVRKRVSATHDQILIDIMTKK
jgi:hypothetical protein